MIHINPYQTQEVRDLAWACFSPPLLHIDQVVNASSGISACAVSLTPKRQEWLRALDSDTSLLLDYLQQRPTHRLGVYFERLWQFFIEQDEDLDMVAHNLAIHDNGRTLGEFDCIYFCRQRGIHVHLELAVKFFLAAPRRAAPSPGDAGDPTQWLGPDNRDRLDLKLDHLLQHQIMLGRGAIARARLAELGIKDLAQEIALKGYLFAPTVHSPPPPPGYNTACTMSHWLPRTELAAHLQTTGATTFLILPKMYWLSPVQTGPGAATMTSAALTAEVDRYFEREKYPLQVAALDQAGVELSRFFVTAPDWPEPVSETPPTSPPPEK